MTELQNEIEELLGPAVQVNRRSDTGLPGKG